jgi:hypothetical protein
MPEGDDAFDITVKDAISDRPTKREKATGRPLSREAPIGNMDSGEGDQSRTQKNRRTVLAPPLEEEDQVGKAEGEGDKVGIGEAQIMQHPNNLARQGELLHAASHNIK